jgi:hypothetical protein
MERKVLISSILFVLSVNGMCWLVCFAKFIFSVTAYDWTWVSGSNSTGQLGVYGTKGIASSNNVPGARDGAVSWIDSHDNLWLFGGENYDGDVFNDLWKFDGTYWTWISGFNSTGQIGVYGTKGIASSNNVPGARFDAVSWIDSQNNLWLFGGYGIDDYGNYGNLNDLWIFDGTDWTWISGSNSTNQAGVYGTKGIASSNNVPGAREGAISWIDSHDNLNNLWLFGGDDYDGLLNDLWKFDGTYWTWISGSNSTDQPGVYGTKGIASSNNIPGARGYTISWIDSHNNLWLFGGQGIDGDGELNDLWKFDGTYWTWISGSSSGESGAYGTKEIPSSNNVPGSRDGAVSWIDSHDNLWLFGGYGFDDYGYYDDLNDLWKFDGTYWTWISGSNSIDQVGVYGTKGIPSPSNVPGARGYAISWIDSHDNLWLFGGRGIDDYGDYDDLNDFWKFAIGTTGTTGTSSASKYVEQGIN